MSMNSTTSSTMTSTTTYPAAAGAGPEGLKRIQLSHQREQFDLEKRHALDILRATKGENAQLVYENQSEAANAIVGHYLDGKVWVVLIAQPGTGKTGVSMEVLRLLGQHANDEHQVHVDDMLVCTGMSDKDWEVTMRNGMLPSLKNAVYHRSRIGKKDVSAMSKGVIVTDECHVAAEAGMTLSKTLKDAGLLDVDALETRRMRMLDVSATPEGVLADLSRWQDKTAVVVLQPGLKYKGFQSMIDDGRLKEAGDYDLTKREDAYKLLKLFDERYDGQTKKYFPIRVPEKSKKSTGGDARANIAAAAIRLGWNTPWIHDSKQRVDDIDEKMRTAPEKHTPILIKGFWRASKRFVRIHVGGSYESKSTSRDDTTTAQGLTARFCDTFDWEGDQVDNKYRPLHFADVKAIKEYLQWCRAGYDYRAAAYKGKRIKSDGRGHVENPMTKVHPDQVRGVVPREEDPSQPNEFGPQIPEIVNITEEEFALYPTGRDFEGKKAVVLSILESRKPALANRLRGYACKEITVPHDVGSTSYRNHIGVAVRNAERRSPCAVTFSQADRRQGNIWNCFVDKHSTPKRLCFVYVNLPEPQSAVV